MATQAPMFKKNIFLNSVVRSPSSHLVVQPLPERVRIALRIKCALAPGIEVERYQETLDADPLPRAVKAFQFALCTGVWKRRSVNLTLRLKSGLHLDIVGTQIT